MFCCAARAWGLVKIDWKFRDNKRLVKDLQQSITLKAEKAYLLMALLPLYSRIVDFYYFFLQSLPPTNPTSPIPNNRIVVGSGTGSGTGWELTSRI